LSDPRDIHDIVSRFRSSLELTEDDLSPEDFRVVSDFIDALWDADFRRSRCTKYVYILRLIQREFGKLFQAVKRSEIRLEPSLAHPTGLGHRSTSRKPTR
jgi:hypothetical protein